MMSDKLRAAALLAVDALDSDDPTIQMRAALNLRAALAEPAIKKSLTVQRPWVGLTDEEIKKVANSCVWSETYHIDFSQAIEAKLREKNDEHI
jgi:hypothetical protein